MATLLALLQPIPMHLATPLQPTETVMAIPQAPQEATQTPLAIPPRPIPTDMVRLQVRPTVILTPSGTQVQHTKIVKEIQ